MDEIRKTLNDRKPGIMGTDTGAEAAVLLPLLHTGGTWQILFEERAHTLARQPGEICFPGGGIEDSDVDEEAAAVRETCEELRVSSSGVEVLGALDLLVMPSSFVLHPFAGILNQPEQIDPDPVEVASVFTVPVRDVVESDPEHHQVFLNPEPDDDFPFERIPGGSSYNWRTGVLPELFYQFEQHTVWGMTARILHHFVQLFTD